MNVLYVLKRYPRLSETFIVREILALEAAGHHIGIDSLRSPEAGPRHADVDRVAATVRVVTKLSKGELVAAHLGAALRSPRSWARLVVRSRRSGERRHASAVVATARRVRRERFEHIHAHFATSAAEVARDVSELTGVPFTVTAHAKDIFHADNEAHLPRRVLGAAAIVTVSQYNVRHLRDVLPGAHAVRYVPNAGERPAPAPRALPSGAPPTVLSVGRLVPKKGTDVLIRAVAALDGVRLSIVGDGTCRSELEALVDELGVRDRVVFHGALTADRVAAHYRDAVVFGLACRVDANGDRDGMPTVLVEAMTHGVPVVSTDIVGVGELVEHNRTGLLVPAEDPEAFAAALHDLLCDRERAERLGTAGRAAAIREFAPERAAAMLGHVFLSAKGVAA